MEQFFRYSLHNLKDVPCITSIRRMVTDVMNRLPPVLVAVFLPIFLAACQQVAGQSDGTEYPAAPAQSTPAPVSAEDAAPVVGPDIQYATAATRESYQKCIDASEGITPKMQDCIAEEYEYQDGRLNAAYDQLMKTLDAAAQAQLRDAQRKWIAERDAECAPADDPGQGQLLEANSCSLRITAARADELEKMLAAATGSG